MDRFSVLASQVVSIARFPFYIYAIVIFKYKETTELLQQKKMVFWILIVWNISLHKRWKLWKSWILLVFTNRVDGFI